jgi:hypothetical protein
VLVPVLLLCCNHRGAQTSITIEPSHIVELPCRRPHHRCQAATITATLHSIHCCRLHNQQLEPVFISPSLCRLEEQMRKRRDSERERTWRHEMMKKEKKMKNREEMR